MSKITDFIQRYPHGTNLPRSMGIEPTVKPTLRGYIPYWHDLALTKAALIELAKVKGYSDEDIAKIRKMLDPQIEPVPVSLDDLYGEEEE